MDAKKWTTDEINLLLDGARVVCKLADIGTRLGGAVELYDESEQARANAQIRDHDVA